MRQLSIREIVKDYTPAYVSNGVVGVRVGPTPLLDDAATVNGFAGEDPKLRVERWCYAPYPVAGDLRLGDTWLSRQPGAASFRGQSYDLATGEVTTRFGMAAGGATATVEVLTYACRSLPNLVVQETTVEVDRPTPVALCGGIRTSGAEGRLVLAEAKQYHGKDIVDGSVLWAAPGEAGGRVGVAYVTTIEGAEVGRTIVGGGEGEPPMTQYAFDAEPGRRYVLRQIGASVPSLVHHEPDRQAIRLANLGWQRGFDQLRAENRAAWTELWQGRPVLHGAGDRWQAIADAAFFYLNSSIHPSSPNSTGLLGCAMWRNYHNFNGHVFWDIETFSFPPVLLSQPAAARAMLDYRFRCLDAARRNAALNGYGGAQFPWESSTRGEEVTPIGWPKIIHEQHITANVANAFESYVHASGDASYERERAWPVLREVAEWVCSRVVRTGRGYEIRCVTGIDEGRDRVDNNSWTNGGAATALRNAMATARRVGLEPPARWGEVAGGMYLPVHASTGAINNYDGCEVGPETNICPDSLFVLFPLGYPVDARTERATLENWLRWGRNAVGWPMHAALQGAWAARLGDRALSLELFERGVADYVFGPFMLFDEFGATHTEGRKAKVGPYLAHCGGFLLSVMYGLTGMQLTADDPRSWPRRAVTLPSGWDAVELPRLWARDRAWRLTARHGAERAVMTEA